MLTMLRPVEREKHQSAMIGRPEPLQNREVGQFQSSEECCQNIVQDILDETRDLLDKANQSALNGAMTETFVKALMEIPWLPSRNPRDSSLNLPATVTMNFVMLPKGTGFLFSGSSRSFFGPF